jgi:hypothetical protein
VVPYQEGLRLYSAANQPKRFIALSNPSTDGFGGHVDGLYDHLEMLTPQLAALRAARD